MEKEIIKISLKALQNLTWSGLSAITWSYSENFPIADYELQRMQKWINEISTLTQAEKDQNLNELMEHIWEHWRNARKGVKNKSATIIDSSVGSLILSSIQLLIEAIQ